MSDYGLSVFSEAVQKKARRIELAKNETLFSEGAVADSIFYMVEGCVRLVVFPQDDKQMVLYRARDGEPFAEEHLALDKYSYRAVADQRSVVLSVAKEKLLDEVYSNPSVATKFIGCLSKRYLELRINFERLGISSAHERILSFLSSNCDAETMQIDLSGKLKSLSDDLNLSHEAVYRALNTLETKGVIRRSDGIIEVLNDLKP